MTHVGKEFRLDPIDFLELLKRLLQRTLGPHELESIPSSSILEPVSQLLEDDDGSTEAHDEYLSRGKGSDVAEAIVRRERECQVDGI